MQAKILFKKLCYRLDALSHYHFAPKPVSGHSEACIFYSDRSATLFCLSLCGAVKTPSSEQFSWLEKHVLPTNLY